MKKIEIFDPAMCCSTGVCGPSVDTELLRISTVINSLKQNNIIIHRFGLSNEAMEFVNNKVINELLEKEGSDVLPVTLVDGEIVTKKRYPTNKELEEWLEVTISEKTPDKEKKECSCKSGCC